jgi:hypothetical protein
MMVCDELRYSMPRRIRGDASIKIYTLQFRAEKGHCGSLRARSKNDQGDYEATIFESYAYLV